MNGKIRVGALHKGDRVPDPGQNLSSLYAGPLVRPTVAEEGRRGRDGHRPLRRCLCCGVSVQAGCGARSPRSGERLTEFGLSLHSDKTRLVEFGRFAEENRKKCGKARPETFDVPGFTHHCTETRSGRFRLGRKLNRARDTLSGRLRIRPLPAMPAPLCYAEGTAVC